MDKIRALIKILFILGDIVEAAEHAFPGSGAGKWKLATAIDLVGEAVSGLIDDIESIRPWVERQIARIVEAKNKLDAWADRLDDKPAAP